MVEHGVYSPLHTLTNNSINARKRELEAWVLACQGILIGYGDSEPIDQRAESGIVLGLPGLKLLPDNPSLVS